MIAILKQPTLAALREEKEELSAKMRGRKLSIVEICPGFFPSNMRRGPIGQVLGCISVGRSYRMGTFSLRDFVQKQRESREVEVEGKGVEGMGLIH